MKFDVVLGSGPYWHDGRYFFGLHVQNHLSLVDSSGYYASIVRNEVINSKPKVFTLLDDFTHVSTTKINETMSVHIWQK